MARTVITNEIIQQINERYYQLHTYAAVARELGISASTVKKYVMPDYSPATEKVARTTELKYIPMEADWGHMCMYSRDEYERVMEFRKEISI